MDHLQLKDIIKLFFEGKLSEQEEVRLLEWIRQSSGNKRYFIYLQRKIEDEFKIKHDKEVTFHWEKLFERIDPVIIPGSPSVKLSNRFSRKIISYAAVFLAGVIITSIFYLAVKKTSDNTVVEQRITAPYGARAKFILPDSSIVWLNSGSELLFPSYFGNTRQVTLKGEAYFDVKQDQKLFKVTTSYGEVEVTGTSFNVKAYPDGLFETTLVEGYVNVLTEKRDKISLRPGYQAVCTKNGFEIEEVDTELYTSWTNGKLILRQEYLPELSGRLERWYNVKIELDNDPRLANIHYTGVIEMESFSEVLNLLSVTAPVHYSWDRELRVIKIFYKNN